MHRLIATGMIASAVLSQPSQCMQVARRRRKRPVFVRNTTSQRRIAASIPRLNALPASVALVASARAASTGQAYTAR